MARRQAGRTLRAVCLQHGLGCRAPRFGIWIEEAPVAAGAAAKVNVLCGAVKGDRRARSRLVTQEPVSPGDGYTILCALVGQRRRRGWTLIVHARPADEIVPAPVPPEAWHGVIFT